MKWFFALIGLFLFAGAAQADDIMRPVTSYTLLVGETSAQISGGSVDNGIGTGIFAVRVVSSQEAHIAIGASPQTATTSNIFLPADVPATFAVRPGEYIAAIRVSANGTLYITELSR